MSEKQCAFPGCSDAVPVKAGPGRKSLYCQDEQHNAVSAFRARKAGEVAQAEAEAQEAGDRSVSLAGSRLRLVAESIGQTLAKQRAWMDAETNAVVDALADLHDLEKVEAELAAVRAEAGQQAGGAEVEAREAVAEAASARRSQEAAEATASQATTAAEAAQSELAETVTRALAAEEELSTVTARVSDLEEELDTAHTQTRVAVDAARVAEATAQAAEANVERAETRADKEIERAEARLAKTEARIETLTEELATLRAAAKRQ